MTQIVINITTNRPFKILLFLLASISFCLSQNVVTEAPPRAQVGESFEIVYTAKNREPDDIQLPNFAPLKVIGGPNRSSQFLNINGQQSVDIAISVYVMAEKAGQIAIPGAKFKFGNKWVDAPSKTIVIEQTNKKDAANLGKTLFIKAELNPKSLYVGQQGILTYDVYFQRDINIGNTISRPDLGNFNSQYLEVRNFNNDSKTRSLNGQNYNFATIEGLALFPNKSGTFEIGALNKSIGIEDGIAEDYGGFFSRKNYKNVQVASNGLSITVKSLPTDRPENFANAVGKYDLKAEVANEGSGYKLYLTIRGDGDQNAIIVPKLKSTPEVEIYDGVKSNEEIDYDGEKLIHTTQYTYALVPKSKGAKSILASYVYFDVEVGEFKTLEQSIDFTAKENASPIISQSENTPQNSSKSWIFGLIGAFLAGGLGIFVVKRLLEKSNPKPSKTNDSKSTISFVGLNDYSSLKANIFQTVGKKYNLDLKDLNRSTIIEKVSQDKGKEIASQIDQIIEKCEVSIYGGGGNSQVDEITAYKWKEIGKSLS